LTGGVGLINQRFPPRFISINHYEYRASSFAIPLDGAAPRLYLRATGRLAMWQEKKRPLPQPDFPAL
jgi:hypothetical protein